MPGWCLRSPSLGVFQYRSFRISSVSARGDVLVQHMRLYKKVTIVPLIELLALRSCLTFFVTLFYLEQGLMCTYPHKYLWA